MHIIQRGGAGKQGGYFLIPESGDAAAYAGNQEGNLRMLCSKLCEIIDMGCNEFHPSMHSGYGVALSLQSYTLPPNSTEVFLCHTRCPAGMMPG